MEASIVIKAVDETSQSIRAITANGKVLSKEFEALERRTNGLARRNDSLKTSFSALSAQTRTAKKAMQEAARALDETNTAANQAKLTDATKAYEDLADKMRMVRNESAGTIKEIRNTQDQMRKLAGSSGMKEHSLASGLAQSGLIQVLGSSIAGAANVGITSALGQPMADVINGTLSGITSGAAMGAILGAPGMMAGAAIGGAAGLLSGGTQAFSKYDDAFRGNVQENRAAVNDRAALSMTAGSTVAGSREMDRLSFSKLIGDEGKAIDFLGQVTTMANATPFLYDDLTHMSKVLLAYGTDLESILPTMTAVGDAGAALGLDSQNIGMVATALGRMNSTDKANLEYMNLLTERGVRALDWLAERDGISTGAVYDKIRSGDYSGKEVADFITGKMNALYGGMMEQQSHTYAGVTSNAEGLQTMLDAATGDGYNGIRTRGKEANNAAYLGELGTAVEEMNSIIGGAHGYLDNLGEQYQREAMAGLSMGDQSTLYLGESAKRLEDMHQEYEAYKAAYQRGDEAAGVKIEALKKEAEAMAASAFEASSGMQAVHDAEIDLTTAIRENTAALGSTAWNQKYQLVNADSIGLASTKTVREGWQNEPGSRMGGGFGSSHAFGLESVPYDNFPA
ncbi:MAG: tape measure protein, partial [Oscillospiraceae bacterium]